MDTEFERLKEEGFVDKGNMFVVWMWWRWVETTFRLRDDACCVGVKVVDTTFRPRDDACCVDVKVVDTTCRLRDDACCCVDVVEVGGHDV